MAAELSRAVTCFLDALDRENRVILIRRYWFGDSVPDIAARCGLRENTVSVRLTRILGRLKRHLRREGFDV